MGCSSALSLFILTHPIKSLLSKKRGLCSISRHCHCLISLKPSIGRKLVNFQHINTQRFCYGLALLLFTCLLTIKQDIKPISFKHQLDASVSTLSIESSAEENAQDDLFPPVINTLGNAAIISSLSENSPPFLVSCTKKSYVTPLTRAPPAV